MAYVQQDQALRGDQGHQENQLVPKNKKND